MWQLLDQVVLGEEAGDPSRFIVVNFMNVKPGEESAYVQLEQDVFKPLHRARVDAGTMRNWNMYALITPGGTGTGYNFGTMDFYDNLQDITAPISEDIFTGALPDEDPTALMTRAINARDLVFSEVWQLVDHTN